MNNSRFEFDVALSYASEDREYVEKVANYLKSRKVSLFYDRDERIQIWGKNLYEYLHDIYSKKARFCVIFISEHYAKKNWPTHELRSAQERAIRENEVYILPARFDETDLPGVSTNTAYIDLRNITPERFADIVLQKLSDSKGHSEVRKEPEIRIPRVQSQNFNKYDEATQFIKTVRQELARRAEVLPQINASLSIFDRDGKTCFRVVYRSKTVYSLDIWMGGISGDAGISFYGTTGEIRSSGNASNAWGEMIWDRESAKPLLSFRDMSLFKMLSSDDEIISSEEFVDRLWNRIVELIEGDVR